MAYDKVYINKSQPTPGDVHISRPLSNVSVAYTQNKDNFIADKVFSKIPVDKQYDDYYKFSKDTLFRDEAQKRAPGTASASMGFGTNTDRYHCDIYSISTLVPDQVRRNADSVINPDFIATEQITNSLLIKREKIWAENFFKTGVWAQEKTGGLTDSSTNFKFWDDDGADPIAVIQNACKLGFEAGGAEYNSGIMTYDVFMTLKNHPSIIDRVKYTTRDTVTIDVLARLFELDKLYIAKALVSTGKEGQSEDDIELKQILSNGMLLCYAAPNPGLLVPSAGYTFEYKGLAPNNSYGTVIKKFRDEDLASDKIEGETAFDMKQVCKEMGYFINKPLKGVD